MAAPMHVCMCFCGSPLQKRQVSSRSTGTDAPKPQKGEAGKQKKHLLSYLHEFPGASLMHCLPHDFKEPLQQQLVHFVSSHSHSRFRMCLSTSQSIILNAQLMHSRPLAGTRCTNPCQSSFAHRATSSWEEAEVNMSSTTYLNCRYDMLWCKRDDGSSIQTLLQLQ